VEKYRVLGCETKWYKCLPPLFNVLDLSNPKCFLLASRLGYNNGKINHGMFKYHEVVASSLLKL
jgi:hypothetical protein